jgi:hypothetical protein
MKFKATYNLFSGKYSVHAADCPAAISTTGKVAFDLDATALQPAFDECVAMEVEKGDDLSPELVGKRWVRVCKCAKGVES